jgi:hypothetical protein
MPPANRTPIRPRHARAEAETLVGGPARVLEPSPPAVLDEWFADDPVVGPGIAPVPTADTTWEKWVADHPEHAAWTADRWLAAYRRLPELPAETATTRLALHRLAAYVVSPARRRVTGKIALRWTLGGIGTPFFGADEQIRIAGTALVRQRGNAAETEPITTLRAAAAFVLDDDPDSSWASQFDVPAAGNLDAPLPVDPTAAGFLADWYGFAWSVLEELRNDGRSVQPSRVQLWPEHFDCAFTSAGTTFGASPGDTAVDEPYLYVLPPRVDDSGLWNAESFPGAILPFGEFVDTADQRGAALDFYRPRR